LAGVGGWPGSYYLRSNVAGAASMRYYVRKEAHRFYADVSWSLLKVYDLLVVGVPTVFDYGPGCLLGYSFISRAGLTVTVGAGLGFRNGTTAIGQLGLGWTFHHSGRARRRLTSA